MDSVTIANYYATQLPPACTGATAQGLSISWTDASGTTWTYKGGQAQLPGAATRSGNDLVIPITDSSSTVTVQTASGTQSLTAGRYSLSFDTSNPNMCMPVLTPVGAAGAAGVIGAGTVGAIGAGAVGAGPAYVGGAAYGAYPAGYGGGSYGGGSYGGGSYGGGSYGGGSYGGHGGHGGSYGGHGGHGGSYGAGYGASPSHGGKSYGSPKHQIGHTVNDDCEKPANSCWSWLWWIIGIIIIVAIIAIIVHYARRRGMPNTITATGSVVPGAVVVNPGSLGA